MTGLDARSRRWLRTLVLVLAVLLLVGAALNLVLRVKWRRELRAATARFEEQVGSLDPRLLGSPPVAAEENAVSWLETEATAPDLDPVEWNMLDIAREPLSSWTPEQRAAARRLVAAHPEVLSLAARSLPLETSSFGAR
jgi:hypothetical protein